MTKLFIATFLIFGFQFETTLPTVEIVSVNMDISTIVRVECSRFDEYFDKGEKKIKGLKSQKDVDNILNQLKNLDKFEGKTATDTRAQILVKYADHVDTICADRFAIYQNGQCYRITDNLKETIWR